MCRQWAILASASGIASNAVDMIKWMNFHLSGGRNAMNVSVMSPALVDMLHAPPGQAPPQLHLLAAGNDRQNDGGHVRLRMEKRPLSR